MIKKKIIPAAVLLLPVMFFFHTVRSMSVNAPIGDDFDAVLLFLNRFLTSGAGERLRLIFSQHNEHRIAFNRLATLVFYYAGGVVDFRALILFGNLALVGLACVLFAAFRGTASEKSSKWAYFIPVTFILFDLQYRESINWAMASMSNFYVLYFCALSLYLLCAFTSAPAFAFALALAVAAAYTQGGGVFVGFVGLAVLLLRKDMKGALVWAIVYGGAAALYFYGYAKPPGTPDGVALLRAAPLVPARFFLAMLGAALPVPELAGVLMLAYFAFLTVRRYYRENAAVYAMLVYLLITVAATAVTRSGYGLDQALSSRYRVIPVMMLALYYISAAELITGQRLKRYFLGAMIAASVVFNVQAYSSNISTLITQRGLLTYGMLKWEAVGTGLIYPFQDKAGEILSDSIRLGVYSPGVDASVVEARPADGYVDFPPRPGGVKFGMETVATGGKHLVVDGWAFAQGARAGEGRAYVVLVSGSKTHVFTTISRQRPDVAAHFKDERVGGSGFFCLIPRPLVPTGEYSVGVLIEGRGANAFALTGRRINN